MPNPYQIFAWAAAGATVVYAMWRLKSDDNIFEALERFELGEPNTHLARLEEMRLLHPASRKMRDAILEDVKHYRREGMADEEIRCRLMNTPIFHY